MEDEEQTPRVWWSRLVREADGITGPAKAVCWFLADVADKNGSSWYSQEQIALKAGVTDRTVRRALADLVVMDIVRVQPPTRQRRTPTVTLLADGLRGWVENPNDHGWTQSPGNADRESTQVGQRVHPRRTQRPPTPDRESYEVPKKRPEEDPKEEIREATTDVRTLTPDPTLLTILLASQRSHTMRTVTPGSRPTEATAAADIDEAMTHPPEASGPSLPSTDGAAPATTPATAQPSLAAPSVVAPDEGHGTAGAFVWLDKPEPAPKRTPKSKPKAKGKPDDAAILAIAAQVDRLKGRPGAALPGSGRWKMLVTAVTEAGADRVLARVTAMADAAQGLPSPAQAVFAQMSGSDWGTDPILRGNNGWTVKLDDAIDAQRASEATGAAGGVVGRLDPQNRSQGQTAPKQSGSGAWDDMLAVIRSTGGMRLSLGLRGSTLSHDPAEHARRCRAVADIGGWAKLCELNDFNRMAIRAQWVAAYDRAGVAA